MPDNEFYKDKFNRLRAGTYTTFEEEVRVAIELVTNGFTEPPVGTILIRALEAMGDGRSVGRGILLFRCLGKVKNDSEVLNAIRHFANRGYDEAIFILGERGNSDDRQLLENLASRGNFAAQAAIKHLGSPWYLIDSERSRLVSEAEKAKQKQWFIATAVFEDIDCPEVVSLRLIRDEYLNRSSFGRTAVGLYYRVSPPIAAILRTSPPLKTMCRRTLEVLVRICPPPRNQTDSHPAE